MFYYFMEDKHTHNAIIIACIVGILLISLLILTGPKTEGFTELYFLDYTKFPENGIISFKYALSNHEAKNISYNVSFSIDGNPVKSRMISLIDNETFVEEYALRSNDLESKVAINIAYLDKKENIHFFTKKP